MPRYIDAEELIKEAEKEGAYGYVSEKQIADFPTADVAEVIRCKECVFHSDSFILNGKRKCNIFCMCTEDGFYCGFGEKMEEVDDTYCTDENCETFLRDLNCERCTK